MRYGREYDPIDPAQVVTPETGVNTFVSIFDNLLYGKFPDGSVKLMSAGGSQLLAAQAVNAGTADDVVVEIDGVASYNSGDYYRIFMKEANTGAMTIDINGIGAVDIKFGGNLDMDMAAGKIMANTVNVFVYTGTNFEFIGMVDGDKVVYEAKIDKADIDPIAVGAQASIQLINLPAYSNPKLAVAKAGTSEFGGGASTAVDLSATVDGNNLFGGDVNLFTGATAAGEGGWSNGVKVAGVIPSTTGLQRYIFAITVTDDTWENLTGGQLEVQFHWDLVPW